MFMVQFHADADLRQFAVGDVIDSGGPFTREEAERHVAETFDGKDHPDNFVPLTRVADQFFGPDGALLASIVPA